MELLFVLSAVSLAYYLYFVAPAREAEKRLLESMSPQERLAYLEEKAKAKLDRKRELDQRTEQLASRAERQRPKRTFSQKVGAPLVLLGVLGLIYFGTMETGVWVSVGSGLREKVANIDLIARRQTGVLLSGGAVGVGVICLVLADRGNKKEE